MSEPSRGRLLRVLQNPSPMETLPHPMYSPDYLLLFLLLFFLFFSSSSFFFFLSLCHFALVWGTQQQIPFRLSPWSC